MGGVGYEKGIWRAVLGLDGDVVEEVGRGVGLRSWGDEVGGEREIEGEVVYQVVSGDEIARQREWEKTGDWKAGSLPERVKMVDEKKMVGDLMPLITSLNYVSGGLMFEEEVLKKLRGMFEERYVIREGLRDGTGRMCQAMEAGSGVLTEEKLVKIIKAVITKKEESGVQNGQLATSDVEGLDVGSTTSANSDIRTLENTLDYVPKKEQELLDNVTANTLSTSDFEMQLNTQPTTTFARINHYSPSFEQKPLELRNTDRQKEQETAVVVSDW